jgi:Tat protein translocase TatB subunit
MEILNVGLGELLFILVIALLVFGPERMPELARQAGRLLAQLRGATDELQRALMSETQPFRDTYDETKREIEASARPLTEVQDELRAATRPLQEARKELDSNLSAVKSAFKPVSGTVERGQGQKPGADDEAGQAQIVPEPEIVPETQEAGESPTGTSSRSEAIDEGA